MQKVLNEDKKIFVIGHRNPDTDSIVSAIAYAWLKQELHREDKLSTNGGEHLPFKDILSRKKQLLPYLMELVK